MPEILERTPECLRLGVDQCPNMVCTYEGMDGERYRCKVCGESYFFDYEEMK